MFDLFGQPEKFRGGLKREMLDFDLIGVPVDCEGTLAGTSRAPEALRRMGFGKGFAHRDLNDLPVSIASTVRDPISGVKGGGDVVATTQATKDAVIRVLRAGRRPLVLGGCCTPVVGAVAAACEVLGEVGLAYIDGHCDLYDGKTSPTGDFADMPMTFLLGRGGSLLRRALGREAVVRPGAVALLGHRDKALVDAAGAAKVEDVDGWAIARTPDEIRKTGCAATAEETLLTLRAACGRFWVHLDWDVLDETEFPSADYLMPNGLTWSELEELVRPLLFSNHLIGLSLACYNPDNPGAAEDGLRIVSFFETIYQAKQRYDTD